MIQTLPLKEIKPNPENPRSIREHKFEKLVQSITDFPDMLFKRPLVVDENNVVLGGNMRLRALTAAGIHEVPVIVAEGWTDEQKREFIIKDNVSFGEWDWDALANEWESHDMESWGLDVWVPEAEVDYSVLDDEFGDLDKEVRDMKGRVKQAIQIEFEADDYETAVELVKECRTQGVYMGSLIIEALRACVG